MSDVMRKNEIMAITVNPKAKLTISNRSYLALIFSNRDSPFAYFTTLGTPHIQIKNIEIGNINEFAININLTGKTSFGYRAGLEKPYSITEKSGKAVIIPIIMEKDHLTSIQLKGV